MDEASKEHAPDEPLLALAKALDLDAFAESKNCELHGVVDVARTITLLKDRRSNSSRMSAAIVRGENAQDQPHHFALVWTRAGAETTE